MGIFYVPFAAFVVVGTSNAVNMTDGLDGLAIGSIMMVSLTLAILSYITGHAQFSEYLFIPFVPGAGELTVVCAAILGASLGFLWFNCPRRRSLWGRGLAVAGRDAGDHRDHHQKGIAVGHHGRCFRH